MGVTEGPGQQNDVFYCDFCGSEVDGDNVEFRLDVNDIFVFCPRCLQRARELEQTMGSPSQSATDPFAFPLEMPPEMLDE